MNQFLNRRTLSLFLLAFIISIIVNGGIRILNVWLSPTEAVLRNLIFATTIVQGVLLVFLIIQWIAQASTQKITQSTVVYMLAGGVYIVAGIFGIMLANAVSPPIKLRGYQDFLSENYFLLEMIEVYVEENGHPPNSLEELYPTYLSPPMAMLPPENISDTEEPKLQVSLPYKSIDAESASRVSYNYKFPVDPDANGQEQWELSIRIYLGSFKSVKFIYNQAQNYQPDYGRIGDWAYTGAYE